jgi:hypothetical protein
MNISNVTYIHNAFILPIYSVRIYINSIASMLPRVQTQCLLTKRHIPKLFFIKLLTCSLVQPLPGSFHYVFFAMSREARSELSQCVQIERPGSSFYVDVSTHRSMIKRLGGVEVGSLCVHIYIYNVTYPKKDKYIECWVKK